MFAEAHRSAPNAHEERTYQTKLLQSLINFQQPWQQQQQKNSRLRYFAEY